MKISHLSFGASSLGSVFRDTNEKESCEAVEAAIEGGINFIDVSPYYGHYKAETVLGKALSNIPRNSYYLSTVYSPSGVNMRAESCTVYTVKAEKMKPSAKKIKFSSFYEPEDYINELKADAPVITVRTSRTVGGEQIFGAVL